MTANGIRDRARDVGRNQRLLFLIHFFHRLALTFFGHWFKIHIPQKVLFYRGVIIFKNLKFMRQKSLFFGLILALSGIVNFGFFNSAEAISRAGASSSNQVIISEPGNYVFKPQWFNAAARTWISQEPSFAARLTYQYNSNFLLLDRAVANLTPESQLLIVDGRDPKNQIETLRVRKVHGGRLLELSQPLSARYQAGSLIKTYLKEYQGYYPPMGAEINLGPLNAGYELKFSHLTLWNSRFNRTGHYVFGPSYSSDSRYYKVSSLAPASWKFDFDDGVRFDRNYNDGSFIVEKKVVKIGVLNVTTSVTNPPEGTKIIKGAATSSVLAEITYDAASSSEDVKITKIRIEANPNLGATAKYVDNVRLYNKATGEELSVGHPMPEFDADRPNEDDYVDFDLTVNPLIVPKGSAVTLLLKAIINSSETSNVSYSFGNSTSSMGVIARGVDTGEAITETYSNAFGNWLTVVNQGVLTIKKSYNTPASSLLVAGATNQTVAVFEIEALYEDITLDYLRLDSVSKNFSPNDVGRVYLYDDQGNLIASAAVSATSTAFYHLSNAVHPFAVAAGETRQLYVKVDLAEIGAGKPGVSGHQIGYQIKQQWPWPFTGIGSLSGAAAEVISSGKQAPIGSVFTLVKAAPVITQMLLSSSESKLAGYELNKTIHRFAIGADTGGGDIGIYKMMFKVYTVAASATDFYLYDVTSQERINFTSSSLDLESEGLLTFYLDNDGYPMDQDKEERVIAAGETRIYELRADTNEDLSFFGNRIVVNMLFETSQGPYPASAQGIDGNGFRFIWSDRSALSHATSTLDWYNSYLVTGQATSTGTVLTD